MESWETNERLIGSARRECLDFMIPIDERHIGRILKEWTTHYHCHKVGCALVGSHRVIIASVRNRQKSWGFRGVSPHFLEVFETLEIVLDLTITFDSILLECSHHVADGKTRQLGSFSKRSLSILVFLDG